LTAEKTAPVADDWVQRMIDSPGRSLELRTPEHVTHYLQWGEPTNPRVMLLLHGYLGHAHWWDFIAPWFARDYRVIAIDFAGMGDSSARAEYSDIGYADQVGEVLKMIGSKNVTLIGHSFGGRISVLVAYRYPEFLHRAIIVDSNIGFSDRAARPRFAPRPKKLYPDLATACSRFHLVPEEPPIISRIMQHLALHSLKPQAGGFVWKFDAALGNGLDREPLAEGELLGKINVTLDFIAGELSVVAPSSLVERIGKALRSGRAPIVIPGAYHHIPADQPLALVAALRALLS
jgi:pimeloyl-ACP methyl ester carboxylesterase